MELGLIAGVAGLGFLLDDFFGGSNENKMWYRVRINQNGKKCVFASKNGPCSDIIFDKALEQYYVVRSNHFLFILEIKKYYDELYTSVIPLKNRDYFEGFDIEGYDQDGYNKMNLSRGGLKRINTIKGGFKEEQCRDILKKITNYDFFSVISGINPILWLRSKIRSHPEEEPFLDFDGYNNILKIAFEFNGPFHYSHKYFNELSDETYKKYRKYIANDEEKKELAKKYKVKLISIPFVVNKNDLEKYIKSRLFDIQYLKNKNPDYIEEIKIAPDLKQYY